MCNELKKKQLKKSFIKDIIVWLITSEKYELMQVYMGSQLLSASSMMNYLKQRGAEYLEIDAHLKRPQFNTLCAFQHPPCTPLLFLP